jgi:23S rRNA (guanosine2251-2'-O)-methyltransferase
LAPAKAIKMRKLINKELGRLTIEEFKNADKIPLVLVLDNIRSANNVGSIFRTADSFGIGKIFLIGFTPTPPHRDIQKTALGATESMEWAHFDTIEDCLNLLKEDDFEVYAIEQTDESIKLNSFQPKQDIKYAFILGNEVEGVDLNAINLSNACIEIPQFGTKHSLNVSVCTGIIVWDFVSKRNFATNN